MSRNRMVTLFLVLALVIVVAAVSWIAGSTIMSPAEAAARTAPPTPSPILVPVEERVLTSDVIARGTARFGSPLAISVVPSPLKSEMGVITSLPAPAAQTDEGDALLGISGRPVFVLQGEVPVFRDLVPGTSGDDVRQLEQGLQRLGYDPGPADGIYDDHTSEAVSDWYVSEGWQPYGPTDEQLAIIRALEHELAAAANRQLTAEDAVAAAPLLVDAARADAESANMSADAQVAARVTDRDSLRLDANATEAEIAAAETNVALAEAAARATRLAGEVVLQTALDAQKAAERDALTAAGAVERISADLEAARLEVGVQVPANEIVFLPILPVRIDQVNVVIGDEAAGSLLTVTNNQLVIDSSLPLDEAPLVRPGMEVAIDEPDLGIDASGVVGLVADTPGTFGVDGFHIYFEVLVDETPQSLAGFSLRLTIPVESTDGAVMTVPISALSLAADGTSRVLFENNGAFEFVAVEPGLSADGFVEVTALDGSLTAGQMVVIGFETAS